MLPVMGRNLSFGLTVPGDELLQFRVLTTASGMADLTGDGNVDGSDLNLWKAAYGIGDGGDTDGDGDTDGMDFLAWQRQTIPATLISAATTSVPEPATWLLGSSAGLLAAFRRRTVTC